MGFEPPPCGRGAVVLERIEQIVQELFPEILQLVKDYSVCCHKTVLV
jgi:hypothetical protein